MYRRNAIKVYVTCFCAHKDDPAVRCVNAFDPVGYVNIAAAFLMLVGLEDSEGELRLVTVGENSGHEGKLLVENVQFMFILA